MRKVKLGLGFRIGVRRVKLGFESEIEDGSEDWW